MKFLSSLFLFFLAIPIFSEEKGRLDREEFDFRYTYLGISYIGANNADSGLAINTSFNLPGPLYLKFERRGDGIDFEKETVDKTTDSFIGRRGLAMLQTNAHLLGFPQHL